MPSDFNYDEPEKVKPELYWIHSQMNPLMDEPDNHVVERMHYYVDPGVKFKACGLEARDYDYPADSIHEFIDVVQSAIAELPHWLQQLDSLIISWYRRKMHYLKRYADKIHFFNG